jgi:MFS family permease
VVEAVQPVPAHRYRVLYYGCKFTAQAAQNLLLAALFVTAGTSSSAAIDLSSVFVAILIPAVAFGAIGGAIVDRIGPARGYFIGSALRFGVTFGALLLLTDSTWAWVIAFAYSTVSQLFTPAEMALVKSLQRNAPSRMHSWLVALQYAGQGSGMLVLAPIFFLIGGLTAMLAAASVGMAVLFVMCAGLAFGLRNTPAVATQENRQAFSFRAVGTYFLQEHAAGYSLITLAYKTIVGRAVIVALPLYLTHEMGVAGTSILYLIIPGVLGVGAALLWTGRSMSLPSAAGVLRASFIGMILCVAALAALDYGVSAFARYSQVPPVVQLEASMNTTFAVAVPIAFLLGIVLTTSLVAARVILTETAPRAQQARVFAVQEMLSESLVVAPLLLTGIGVQYAGARPTLAVVAAVGLLAMILMEMSRIARERRLDLEAAPPDILTATKSIAAP